MTNAQSYTKNQIKAGMLLAYVAFVDDGIDAVKRAYPQYLTFVLENQGKTITQVKYLLEQNPASC